MKSPERGADELDLLAAEFVLGTLAREDRFDADELRETDAAFEARVVWWEGRLQPLCEMVPQVEPSEQFSARLLRTIRRRASHLTAVPSAPSAPVSSAPDIDGTRSRQTSRRSRRSRQLRRWRAAAIAASLATIGLAAVLVNGLGNTVPPESIAEAPAPQTLEAGRRTAVSLLRDEQGEPRFMVEIRDDDSVSIVALNRDPAREDSSLQLWMADGVSGELRSVGLLPRDPWSSLELSQVPLIDREPAFAVSVEPPGGSPDAGPTGDVVFQGTIHPVRDGR